MSKLLFNDYELRKVLDHHRKQALDAVEKMGEDELLSRSDESILTELVAKHRIEPLTLEPEPEDMRPREVGVDMGPSIFHEGRRSVAPGLAITGDYHFEGEADLFFCRASTYTYNSPRGHVNKNEGLVHLTVEFVGTGQTAEQVKAAFSSQVATIQQHIGWVNSDVAQYNAQLTAPLTTAITTRKQRVLSKRNLMGEIGFPIRARDDAPRPVPMRRKTLGTERRAAAKPRTQRTYSDEYAISDADYEEIVGVIQNTLLGFERSPGVLTSMREESIRDHLLIQLNGTFEGAATGETFVVEGKTDVLVRIENRHVFVGECKWWKGAKKFTDAIDQLLSYLPWRDEKAALMIFIGGKDASNVIQAASAAMQAHPQFVRLGRPSADPSARRNYVLSHPTDADREIKTAVLFAVIRKDDAED